MRLLKVSEQTGWVSRPTLGGETEWLRRLRFVLHLLYWSVCQNFEVQREVIINVALNRQGYINPMFPLFVSGLIANYSVLS